MVPLNDQVIVEFDDNQECVEGGVYLINGAAQNKIGTIIAMGERSEKNKNMDSFGVGDKIVVKRAQDNLESSIINIQGKKYYIFNLDDVLGLIID